MAAMKKLLILILTLMMLSGCRAPIGTVSGPEWDTVTVNGVEYIKAPPGYDIYGSSDKDDHLGIIKSGDNTFHVYTIKGDTEGEYLYVRWEWEGDIDIRKDLVKE